MSDTQDTSTEQSRLWNGPSGRAWVESQELLDQILQPFEDLLAAEVRARRPRRLLDVGCGTGATTLAAARLLGTEAQCTGIDISEPMLALARARAERDRTPARFVCADAQDYPFDASEFDMVISRFGVMFFADPVRAFANLRRAAAADARLRVVAWRGAPENPFMTAAERAAAPLLPDLPARQPGAPGQFAFANAARVRAILADGGWTAVNIHPLDVPCSFPQTELVHYVTRLGPVGGILQEADESIRRHVLDAVLPAFEPYVHDGEVRFTAACWLIAADA